MKNYQLKQIREKTMRLSLRQMSRKTRISPSQLSKIESGQWPAKKIDALKIAKAYGLNKARVLRNFIRHDEPKEVLDVLGGLFSSPKTELASPELQLLTQMQALNPILQRTHRDILTALAKCGEHMLRPSSRLFETIEDPADESGYAPLAPGKHIKHKLLFASRCGTPILVSLHRFPPSFGGYHRERIIPNCNPLELWCVISGTALIILRDVPSGFRIKHVCQGACGYYQGKEDHICQNTSTTQELIMFHICYPYLGPAQGALYSSPKAEPKMWTVSSSGEEREVVPPIGEEFTASQKKAPKKVPSDIWAVLQKANKELNRSQSGIR